MTDFFELREVAGKRVFIVDDHHKAFAAWAVLRRERHDAPILITFDHHTDTYEAFHNASLMKHQWNHEKAEVHRQELAAKLGWATDDQVAWAVERLQHDEHIDAATSCGVLRASFSIQLSDPGGWPSVSVRRSHLDPPVVSAVGVAPGWLR